MKNNSFIKWFDEISIADIGLVGGKNASLGEMYRELSSKGINIPFGFALTAEAYWLTLKQAGAIEQISMLLAELIPGDVTLLRTQAKKIRSIIRHLPLPEKLQEELSLAYRKLCEKYGQDTDVAVRSSATAEDLPQASFAGQQESYLNISGEKELFTACQNCFASLFTERAISYRNDQGFDHLAVALSVGVQKMVRSDLASSGVIFSIDTESGFKDVILITGAFGLGENVVQGNVNPDEFSVFKPTLRQGFQAIISKTLGSKKLMMVYDEAGKSSTKNVRTPVDKQNVFVLNDDEIVRLANWTCLIEEHYSAKSGRPTPMDVEWAKDGRSNELYIVQARPETVVSRLNPSLLKHYSLKEKSSVLVTGRAVGEQIGSGVAHIINTASEISKFRPGEVLVTSNTDPDWEPIMKIAAAIVTDHGGRTSHAAIVSRELGIPCIVGCGNATSKINDNSAITVSCAEGEAGKVYQGKLEFEVREIDVTTIPSTRTKLALNIGSPENAFKLSFIPNDGVGLAREEFIISETIGIHPRALIEFDTISEPSIKRQIDALTRGYRNKPDFFVEKLAHGVSKIAAAFYPKPVIVRLSDFKSNEYASLLGGRHFEPKEENPMIGWRGASRYYSAGYRDGFALECKAMKKAREEFGLTNIILMIPFCRTTEEAKKVIAVMKEHGLEQGKNSLQIYGMCEIPANVLLAEEFLDIFDGFSIGSNDLTQLTLGLDRDSELVADIFDERNEAVKILIKTVIETANRKGKYIGICGDAPSTFPDFTSFLIRCGIGTISLSPDVAIKSRLAIAKEESQNK